MRLLWEGVYGKTKYRIMLDEPHLFYFYLTEDIFKNSYWEKLHDSNTKIQLHSNFLKTLPEVKPS